MTNLDQPIPIVHKGLQVRKYDMKTVKLETVRENICGKLLLVQTSQICPCGHPHKAVTFFLSCHR